MFKYLKSNLIIILIIFLLILSGVFLFFVDAENFLRVFSIISAIYLFLVSGWLIFSAFRYKEYLAGNPNFFDKPLGYLVQGLILLILGILILIFPKNLVRIFVGIVLILIPLVNLILNDDKIAYFKRNFWKFIIGLLVVFAFQKVLEIIFIIVAILMFSLAGFLIYLLFKNYQKDQPINLATKYIMVYIIKKNEED